MNEHYGRLNGAYTRLSHAQARITPAETVIIMRDMHNRLMKLEETHEEKSTTRGRGTGKVSKREVSSD